MARSILIRLSKPVITCIGAGKESNGHADASGDYEGTFTRWFCHEEMRVAREEGLHPIGVKEIDPRFGAPDLKMERRRAMTGGSSGGPVHEKAAENIELLDQVCFIVSAQGGFARLTAANAIRLCQDRQTQQHLLPGYLDEIIKQGIVDARAREPQGAGIDASVEGTEPEPELAP